MKRIMNNYEFRNAGVEDISQMNELMCRHYINKKFGNEYFLWQYFNSAFNSIVSCAFLNSELVGMFGLQEKKLNNNLVIHQAVDLIIKEEHRGKGLFRQLGEKAFSSFNNIKLVFVLPNQYGKKAMEKSFGLRTISQINSLEIRLQNYKNNYAFEKSDYLVNNDIVNVEYNKEIINWRFFNHPYYRYEKIKISENCYGIVKEFNSRINNKSYLDLVYFSPKISIIQLNDILIKLSRFYKKKGIPYLTTWSLPHLIYSKFLVSSGFEEIKNERYFCIKILDDTYNYLYDIKNWIIFQSDTEFY